MSNRDKPGASKTLARGAAGKVSASPGTDSGSGADWAVAVDPCDADSPTGSYVIPTSRAESALCYSIALNLDDTTNGKIDSGTFPSWTAAELDAWQELAARKEEGAQPPVVTNSPATRPVRVFVADHEPLAIRGLRGLFDAEPGFVLVGQSDHGAGLLRQIADAAPDVVLIDFDLPEDGGLAVAGALLEARLEARVVLMANRVDEEQFLRARKLGVRGIVLKSMPLHLLLQCVRTVHDGKEFIEKDLVIKALSSLERRNASPEPKGEGLTARERAVVELAAAGMSNEQISQQLGVGAGTVKSHLRNIYDKLGVHSRFALMRLAGKH